MVQGRVRHDACDDAMRKPAAWALAGGREPELSRKHAPVLTRSMSLRNMNRCESTPANEYQLHRTGRPWQNCAVIVLLAAHASPALGCISVSVIGRGPVAASFAMHGERGSRLFAQALRDRVEERPINPSTALLGAGRRKLNRMGQADSGEAHVQAVAPKRRGRPRSP
jgi:hypothetical protein